MRGMEYVATAVVVVGLLASLWMKGGPPADVNGLFAEASFH